MPSARPTILVAEDTPSNVKLLQMILGADHELIVASTGEEAVDLALAETPDLILLDVIMPEMDGFEVCAALKADPRTADVPIIFITSLSEEDQQTRGLELGAVDFIAKPFSPPVVRARVRNHLELKRQSDTLRGLSFLDGLTGIPNRRRFDQFLDLEWRRAVRTKTDLSIVLMDIDFFKHFNDAAGHLAGDDCLRRIALALAGVARRPADLAARYGGEEFVCVLSETDAGGALRVAERIRETIAALALPHPRSPIGPLVTLSLGVASLVPTLESNAEALIQAADSALYRAKAAGRDRVVVAGA